jgi:type VII secretion protein EccB
MASRKDQLQSHQFLLQRVVSAMVMRETDPAQAPLRRGVGAVFIGIMIAVIVAAAFGVYGLLTRVGTGTWKVDHAVIVEKETGATFVYTAGNPAKLTPTLNFTSALLLSGQSPPTVFRVTRSALANVPRDVPRGIVGAPSSLPDSKHITGTPWTLCAVPSRDLAGNPITTTQLAVGRAPTGGRALGEDAALVRDARTADMALIWHSHRYRVTSPTTVLLSLFGDQRTVISVGTAWLNGLPEGADIGPITITGRGARSAAVPGRHVGDLVFDEVGTGAEQFYVVLRDGLAAITELQKDILAGQSSANPAKITPADVNRVGQSSQSLAPPRNDTAPPSQVPQLATIESTDNAVCAESTDARSTPSVMVDATAPGPGTQTASQTAHDGSLADVVAVPAGHLSVVEAMASSTATAGAISIVTDVGVRFAVPSVQVLNTLGYQAGSAVQMPASLVNRIPVGPTLSPDAAAHASAADQPG